MKMSDRDYKSQKNREMDVEQDTYLGRSNIVSSDARITKQSSRNTSKRTKRNDDSFEREHRMANTCNQYFNDYYPHQDLNATTSQRINIVTNEKPSITSACSSFPPFRINFSTEHVPSELSIIKEINKVCRISLSYGHFSSVGDKKRFLVFTNSSEQFDRLMDKSVWPSQICSIDVSIDFPNKVPPSHSLVATGIPTQWNLDKFAVDLKMKYPTIIKVERLRINGGIPISKVRIDFSSSKETNKIKKAKRLLIDDNNTAFAIQPYSPPPRILRCFNCQKYNDHVAAKCPQRNSPICFRCG